jgi:hypothetical protein
MSLPASARAFRRLSCDASGLDLGHRSLSLDDVGVDEFGNLPHATQEFGRGGRLAGTVGASEDEKIGHALR